MSFTPNTTPTPNWLYNGEMKKMNETELKVVLLITRKTLGWFDPTTNKRKSQDYISQSQFMNFTGQSHTAIAQAIQSSVKNGWIIAKDKEGNLCDTSEKRRRRRVWYQLGNIFTNKISKQESGLDENLSNKVAKSKQQSCTHLSNKVDNTKVTITKETIQNTEQSSGEDISEIIYSFKEVNPSYKKYFGNTTQRKAVDRLLQEHGKEKLFATIKFLSKSNKEKYAPTITTPVQLEDKLGQLISWSVKIKNNKTKVHFS